MWVSELCTHYPGCPGGWGAFEYQQAPPVNVIQSGRREWLPIFHPHFPHRATGVWMGMQQGNEAYRAATTSSLASDSRTTIVSLVSAHRRQRKDKLSYITCHTDKHQRWNDPAWISSPRPLMPLMPLLHLAFRLHAGDTKTDLQKDDDWSQHLHWSYIY